MGSGGVSSWLMVLAAFSGALGVFILVMSVSFKIRDSMSLLIIGIMFGSITGAIVGTLQYFSNAEQIQVFLIWTLGSLGGLTWDELTVFIPVVIIGLLVASVLFKPLNAMLLGDNYAKSMGIHLKSARGWIIVSTSLLAGTVTAFCGPIAFIGLAVPHLAGARLGHDELMQDRVCVHPGGFSRGNIPRPNFQLLVHRPDRPCVPARGQEQKDHANDTDPGIHHLAFRFGVR